MRYDLQLRPGMTAIAAVIALSTTPVFAQDATQPVTQPPVVTSAPPTLQPEIVPADAAIAPSDVSPALSQADAAPVETQATPAPAPVPTMQPIVHQATAAELAADRAPATRRAATPAPAERTRIAAPAPVAIAPAPTPIERTATPIAAPEQPIAAAAPVQRTTTTAADDDALPYIGAGAAALLVIGGAAALTRRRRRDENAPEERYESEHVLELEPAPLFAEPSRLAPVMAREMPVSAGAALPSGFDLSRFGRHTQAAYQGPTPENPSLSLRNRLKRASFFDGRERLAVETGKAPVGVPIAAAARAAQAAGVADGQVVIRPRAAGTRNFFRPSFAG